MKGIEEINYNEMYKATKQRMSFDSKKIKQMLLYNYINDERDNIIIDCRKDIKIPAFIEALLNIFLSIILVSKFGLNGVAIGTLVAMTYRMVFQINYTSKLIKDRKQTAFYKKIFIFVITTILGLVVCNFIPKTQYNIMSWLIHGIIYLIIFLSLYFIISLMFFKNELKYFKKYLFRK